MKLKGRLFRSMTAEIEMQIRNVTPCIESIFFDENSQDMHWSMKLIKNTLILNELNKQAEYLPLTFDVKFEVVYEEEVQIY